MGGIANYVSEVRIRTSTGWPKKFGTIFSVRLRPNFTKMLTDFQNYCTVRIRRKFVIILLLKVHHTLNLSLH